MLTNKKRIALSLLIMLGLLIWLITGCKKDSKLASNKADNLKINLCMRNNSRTMTYQKSDPLTMKDGTVITQGDLKPTWQYISNALGINLVDTAVQDQAASDMLDIQAATNFKSATIFGGSSCASQLMNYGAQGYFINIKEYLDKMPNLKAYLNKNPNIAKAVTAFDGGIYHLPYAAEIGNYARVYCGRPDWVKALLDSDSQLENESHTLTVYYKGYWKNRHASNVIDLQNAAARGGVLDRNSALSVLLNYIKKTYPKLEKPSDLYLGRTAQYDIDELIALWRVVELSPNTLSKVTTGKIVPGYITVFILHCQVQNPLIKFRIFGSVRPFKCFIFYPGIGYSIILHLISLF